MTTMMWSSDFTVWSNEASWKFKGDATAQAAEQQQAAFDTQLMTTFQAQYGQQQKLLTYLQGKLQPMVDNPTGYSAPALAAMRTSATDSISGSYQNAQRALNNEQVSQNGGSDLPSGTSAQLDAALLNSEASDKSNAQDTITLNDENLKQSNYWNALNVLNGQATTAYNPLGYAGAATSGAGAVSGLSQAVTQSSQSQLLGALGGIAGGAGSAIGGMAKAGMFCHVAASFWGWNDDRTKTIRLWMFAVAPRWFFKFYQKYSEQISKTPLRWAFRPVFEGVLRFS